MFSNIQVFFFFNSWNKLVNHRCQFHYSLKVQLHQLLPRSRVYASIWSPPTLHQKKSKYPRLSSPYHGTSTICPPVFFLQCPLLSALSEVTTQICIIMQTLGYSWSGLMHEFLCLNILCTPVCTWFIFFRLEIYKGRHTLRFPSSVHFTADFPEDITLFAPMS